MYPNINKLNGEKMWLENSEASTSKNTEDDDFHFH